MSAQFKVGQTVSGDDFAYLPRGTVVAGPGVPTRRKDALGMWVTRDSGYPAAVPDKGMAMSRTITYIPDAPEFVVGQQVSTDDYPRLPVGAQALYKGATVPLVKGADEWTYLGEPMDGSPTGPRTLTYLPDAAEPEDKDDLYVEPEPLKESPRDVYPARPVRLTDRLGAILFDGMATVEWTSTGAIGTITPVKPARCTSLYRLNGHSEPGVILGQCSKDEHDSGEGHSNVGSDWTDAEEYGRVEVSS